MSLLTNLISYWKLDEASGNALDSHGSNNLTDFNTVGSATGIISNARDFERDNQEYFNIADNSDVSFGDEDFTISCWVKFESGAVTQMVIGKSIPSAIGGEYMLYRYLDDKLYWLVTNGAGGIGQPVSDVLSNGVWYFVVVWHDSVANTVNLQVNNGTVQSDSYSGGCNDGTGTFGFGWRDDIAIGPDHLDALLDEVGLWNRVLTSQERTDLYNGGTGLPYSSFGGESSEIISARQFVSVP